jgi:hypothetical protein
MLSLGMLLQQRQQLVSGLWVCSAPPGEATRYRLCSVNSVLLPLLLLPGLLQARPLCWCVRYFNPSWLS